MTDRGSLRGEVTARIADGGSSVARGADTAGSALRSSRLVDRANIDVDSLDAEEQANLRAFLTASGEDGADYLDGLSDEQRKTLLGVDACRATSSDVGTNIDHDCSLDWVGRDILYQRIWQADAPEEVVEKLNKMDRRQRHRVQSSIVTANNKLSITMVWSVRHLSASRLETIVDSDVSFKRHAEVLAYYREAETDISGKGDLAEVIAHEQIVEKYSDAGTTLPRGRAKGVTVSFKSGDQQEQEWDHLVLGPSGEVKYLLETKSSDGLASKAQDQLDLAQKLDNREFDRVEPERPPVSQLTTEDFKLSDKQLITIGPKGSTDDYDDSLPFTADELSVASKSIEKIQQNQ